MTGYGRADFRCGERSLEVELRSVNHRYLEVRARLPRPLTALELPVCEYVRERCDRGKIDVNVQLSSGAVVPTRLEVDGSAAAQYVAQAEVLRREYALEGGLAISSLLALPGVVRISESELSVEMVHEPLFAALAAATSDVLAMREREGAALERDLRERLAQVARIVDKLEVRAGAVQEQVRERLYKRAQQLSAEIGLSDDSRLYQEVALAAERLDISEELVRTRSHAEQFAAIMDAARPGAPAGRRLDFLLQELSREANTIGAKIGDAEGAHLVVELKSELERMREQVQNVE